MIGDQALKVSFVPVIFKTKRSGIAFSISPTACLPVQWVGMIKVVPDHQIDHIVLQGRYLDPVHGLDGRHFRLALQSSAFGLSTSSAWSRQAG